MALRDLYHKCSYIVNVFLRMKPEGIHLTTRVLMVQANIPPRAMEEVTCTLMHILCCLHEACRHMLHNVHVHMYVYKRK